jgi:phosphoglycerate dehydrogenase-like enzyme
MKKQKLLYYKKLNFQQSNLKLLESNFEVTIIDSPDDDNDDLLKKQVICFAPLGFYFDTKKISKMDKLRIICTNTTSTPHIDINAASERGISIISLKNEINFLETITPTAEHTWGLMLALMRNIPRAFNSVKNGEWSRWPYGSPKMLSRMSIGIVGLGRIGKMVAKYAKAFDMNVKYFDPYVQDVSLDVVRVGSLEELVSSSDIVSLHLHLTDETNKIINSEMISKFKRGSWLINTSRGELIDNSAMIESLNSGKLAGAALDVISDEFEQGGEFNVSEHDLVKYASAHNNLIITPHIAGSTVDAWTLTQEHVILQVIKKINKKSYL